MNSNRRPLRKSSETLSSLQPGVWQAGWYPLHTPPDVAGVFHASVFTFESTFSAAC
jgi:hypothetical protein